jgi:hypothetical protein
MRLPRWRKMTWMLIIWCALILAWAVAGAASNDCAQQTYQSACQAGTGIGVTLILGLGFFGFVFLSLILLMTRPRDRDCPVCGTAVKRGMTVCAACGHDFAASERVTGPPAAA